MAEVLITLGIIGIVAALTMPSLIEKHQKLVTLTRLKKAYNIMSNAIQSAQSEYGPVHTWELRPEDRLLFSKKYLEPYLKVVSSKNYQGEVFNVSGFKMQYCSPFWDNVPCTYDGMCFWTCGVSDFTDYNYIVVDLNGITKPNRAGRDIFIFSLDFSENRNKGALLSGKTWRIYNSTSRADLLSNCTKDKSKTSWGNSLTCFELILRDNWSFGEDYPW